MLFDLAPAACSAYSSSMTTPERIHFFSWETRVSIELPIGFEEQMEDPQTNSVIYADEPEALDDSDESGDIAARVMTGMTAVPEGSPDAYRTIAEESAGLGFRTVEHREELVIDGAPAIRHILSYCDDQLKVDVLRHETFAQLANVVFAIICLAPASRSAEYRPAFDHATDTARFILLPTSGVTA